MILSLLSKQFQSSFQKSTIKRNIMKLSSVIQILESFAPTHLAEQWDNVGVLVQPSDDITVKNIFFTNDLTESVMNEAVSANCNLIVSYHPPIFKPLKRLTQATWKERIIVKCLENKIALYSPHTSWDSCKGGVNDWLLQPFDLKSSLIIEGTKTCNSQVKIVSSSGVELTNFIKSARDAGFISEPLYSVTQNNNCEALVNLRHEKKKDLILLNQSHLDIQLSFTKSNQETSTTTGCGRIAHLKSAVALKDMVSLVKEHVNLQHLQLCIGEGKSIDSPINSLAVCAGSGGSLLAGLKVDLLLTGEMSHHELLDACANGVSVILTCHSNSERGFLSFVSKKIKSELDITDPDNNIEITLSHLDRDPLLTV